MKELLVTLSAAVILGFVNTGGAAEANNFEKDRKAILAMSGKFDVEFTFKETVALVPGYELKQPYRADALEIRLAAPHGLSQAGVSQREPLT